jgi:hypothetical protein
MSGIFFVPIYQFEMARKACRKYGKKIVNLIDTIVLEATYIMYKI